MTTESPREAGAAATASATSTGDARVDAVIDDIAEIDTLPVGDHVERFAEAHSRLQDALNTVSSSVPSEAGRSR